VLRARRADLDEGARCCWQEIPEINFLRSELSAMVKIEAAMMLGSRPRVSDDQAPSARPPARRSLDGETAPELSFLKGVSFSGCHGGKAAA
jgi:hypothetical protein